MSKSLDIFVKPKTEMENFIKQIEFLLGIKLRLIYDENENWYEYQNSTINLTLGTHEFENDKNMNFEDYDYYISIRSLNIEMEEKREKWRNDFAQNIFNKLKETQKYQIMLVDDLQKKLEEFSP